MRSVGDGDSWADDSWKRDLLVRDLQLGQEQEGAPGIPPVPNLSHDEAAAAFHKLNRWIEGDSCATPTADHDWDACVDDRRPRPNDGAARAAVAFLQEPGEVDSVSPGDVHQEQLGDCALLATLAGLASTPEGRALIHGAVRENKDATGSVVSYSVKLFQVHDPMFFGAKTFTEKWIDLPADAPYVEGHARAGGDATHDEIWPLLFEKAYAKLNGGYNAIGTRGYPSVAIEALTGKKATRGDVSTLDAEQLKDALAAHEVVVLTSKRGLAEVTDYDNCKPDNPYCIVVDHAYSVMLVEDRAGVPVVHLSNPYGQNAQSGKKGLTDPQPVPLAKLADWFSAVDMGSP